MPENELVHGDDGLRVALLGHVEAGFIRLSPEGPRVWERGIYEPWRPIEDESWIQELSWMLSNGDIVLGKYSGTAALPRKKA